MKCVYFIKPIGSAGPIKIGFSGNVEQRLTALSRKSMPLEIIATFPGGHFVERQFHTLFRQSHISREWFFPTVELLAAIEAIKSDKFDSANLPEQPVRLPRKPIDFTPERRAKMSEAAKSHNKWRREYRDKALAKTVTLSPESQAA